MAATQAASSVFSVFAEMPFATQLLVCAMVHLLLCALVAVLMRLRVLKAPLASLTLMLFVPVFGALALVALELRLRDRDARGEEFDIEELRVNEAIHRSILMEQSTVGEQVVPMQEALLLNDATMRRELIMDVLYEGAEDQPGVLRAARSNDDVEVVHYATTALVELQKSYDARLAEVRARVAAVQDAPAPAHGSVADQEAVDARRDYVEVLDGYIQSGLLEGTMLVDVRGEFARALHMRLGDVPPDSAAALDAYVKLFRNAVRQGDMTQLPQAADQVVKVWPQREEGYLMRLYLAVYTNDRDGVEAALAHLTSGEVRLSAHGRRMVEFWKGGDGHHDA